LGIWYIPKYFTRLSRSRWLQRMAGSGRKEIEAAPAAPIYGGGAVFEGLCVSRRNPPGRDAGTNDISLQLACGSGDRPLRFQRAGWRSVVAFRHPRTIFYEAGRFGHAGDVLENFGSA